MIPERFKFTSEDADRLLASARELASAAEHDDVVALVKRDARQLVGADGVCFILREDEIVHYVDEDAIGPLWKGRRFPIASCVSGWAMVNRQTVVIADVERDERVPLDLYLPTFARSLVMVPVRAEDPIAAIGVYWAARRLATPREVALLEALAGFAGLAVENVRRFKAEVDARAQAIRAAAQVRQLQEVTAHATLAPTSLKVARVIVDEGMAALGAAMGAAWLVTDDGRSLELLHWAGGGPADRFRSVPIDEDSPVPFAVRCGAPVWLGSFEEYEREFPAAAAHVRAESRGTQVACAALPLVVGERAIGGLLFAFVGTRIFSEDERRFLMTIARQCAHAMERLRLLESEQRARQVQRLLADAGAMLSSSLEDSAIIERVTNLIVPELADFCFVDLVDDEWLERVAIAHADPAMAEVARMFPRRFALAQDEPRGIVAAVVARQAPLAGEITDELLAAVAPDPEHVRAMRAMKGRSFVAAPLLVGGRSIGALTFVSRTRSYGDRELQLGAELARRTAAVLENARLYAVQAAARRQAELLQERAEAASRAKDEFLAMLGHELRNPLSPIVTALHLMKLRETGHYERERAIVERQVQHLVRLVDDLLDVSRITRGKVQLHLAPVELSHAVAAAIEGASPLIESRGHHLTVDVAASGLTVNADPERLSQIIANLLTNAAKYTPNGGRIAVEAAAEPGYARLTVRDNGIGIPETLLPKVFDMFIQGERAADRAEGGLGLGLAIVRSLVQLHGGTVSVGSEGAGRGTEFTVRIPIVVVRAPSAGDGEAARLDRAPGRRLRVLIVDDNADAGMMLGELLRMFGHEPTVVHDGPSALIRAAAHPPDVAFLDIGLPVMDGYELAGRLRALPGLGAIPLIAVTGYGQASDKARSREAGFADHLVKPVDLAKLRSRLEDLAS